MQLAAAFTELAYAKDWTPSSRRCFTSRLGAFFAWAEDQGITELERITASLVRRYVDERRTAISRTGKPLDSHTLSGHVRAIRALLHWAVVEGLVDANVPKRIALPRKEQKVLAALSDEQISRLFRAAQAAETRARDTALPSLLLGTGCRAAELTGLTLDDVHLTPDDAWLLVRGKGRKQRQVALGHKARADLARRCASRVSPQTAMPSWWSRRAPGSPPAAKARYSSPSRKRSVRRACGTAIPGRRSVKMRREHSGVSQKKRRGHSRIRAGILAHGRSASVRRYHECTRAEGRPHKGQGALVLQVRILRTMLSGSATTASRCSRVGSRTNGCAGIVDLLSREILPPCHIGLPSYFLHQLLG